MKQLLVSSRRYRLKRLLLRYRGLIAYFPLNEVEGSQAKNYARLKSSPNGVISGNPSLSSAMSRGRGYSFDGITGTVGVSPLAINSHNEKSVIFIGRIPATSINRYYHGFGTSFPRGTLIKYTATMQLQLDFTSSPSGLSFSSAAGMLSVGKDYFLGYSNDEQNALQAITPADAKIYINGQESTSSTSALGSQTTTQTYMNLGSAQNASNFGQVSLQHFAVFNRQLSNSEMRKLAHTAGFV